MFSVAPDASSPFALAAPISASDQDRFAVPSKALPVPPTVRVLAVTSLEAVAALPVVLWLPAVFTPGRLIFAVPSKATPPIVLAAASLVAATAVAPVYKAPISAAVGLRPSWYIL